MILPCVFLSVWMWKIRPLLLVSCSEDYALLDYLTILILYGTEAVARLRFVEGKMSALGIFDGFLDELEARVFLGKLVHVCLVLAVWW